MDDLAHELPRNTLKRKADQDDLQCPEPPKRTDSPHIPTSDPICVDTSVAHPRTHHRHHTNAPRQPYIAPISTTPMCLSPASPSQPNPLAGSEPFPKRPRTERHPPSSPPTKSRRKILGKSRQHTVRQGNDIEDIGIISNADPGPSTGSLLHLRESLPCTYYDDLSTILTSPSIPPLVPLISRQTLKELDFDIILRNPQLRHDLLFDSGLQFRPTLSRRKRDMADRYWGAILQELQTGCTCVSFDLDGRPRATTCACQQIPLPDGNPIVLLSPSMNMMTLRMPSRIRNLLEEFLHVLLLVIQPLSNMTTMYINTTSVRSHMQEHSAQANHLRQVFDPALIEQELKHNIFDPSGLFTSIGQTLKGHCAPMRDRAVEMMVQAAQECGQGGKGNKVDAVKAVRMCMEILELMKLDIANHQLHRLRPSLIRTSGTFELKTFKNRKGDDCSIVVTQQWLHAAHDKLLGSKPIPHPLYPTGILDFSKHTRNQRAYLAALKGFVDLIFEPPVGAAQPLPPPPSLAQTTLPTIQPLAGYPETSYLDSARLVLLSIDAADLTALYMYSLLYRQLVHSDNSAVDARKLEDESLVKIKNELRDIGSGRLGFCFSRRYNPEGGKGDRKEVEKWRGTNRDVVLQIAMRAKQARSRKSTLLSSSPSSASLSASSLTIGSSLEAPDEQLLNLAQRWTDTNMQPGSALSTMLRDRLRGVVFNAVVSLAYPGRDATNGKPIHLDISASGIAAGATAISSEAAASTAFSWAGTSTGMEPLADEIRSLSEKISRLALIHLNAYLPLYEQEDFWQPRQQ